MKEVTNLNAYKLKFDSSILIYFSFIITIFLAITPYIGLAFLFLSLLFIMYRDFEKYILIPCYMYPFMFLIRAQDPNNIFLAALPDLTVLFAIFVHFLTNKIDKRNIGLFILISSLASFVFIVNMFHVGEFYFAIVIFRQYVLPLLYLFIVINTVSSRTNLSNEAFRISIISFSIISLISLLNILGIIYVPRSMPALYPYLNFIDGTDNIEQISRTAAGFSFPRINLFTGGALGSSAAIFFLLGMVSFSIKNNLLLKYFSIPLFISALLTLSSSILFALAAYFLAFYLTFIRSKTLLLVLFIIPLIIYLFTNFLVSDISPAEYFFKTTMSAFFQHMLSLNFFEFFFGVGPRLTSAGYLFLPDKFIIDVGIFRVFVESGIIAFSLFASVLLIIFQRAHVSLLIRKNYENRIYFAVFLIFLFLIHANMTALPPFYPLFCFACLGLSTNKFLLNK